MTSTCTHDRFRTIEQALVRAARAAGAEIHVIDGVFLARVYNWDYPSIDGGHVGADLNLSRIAGELEREIS